MLLAFTVLNEVVAVECDDPSLVARLGALCGAMPKYAVPGTSLRYTVKSGAVPFVVSRDGGPVFVADDLGHLVFLFEKDLTVELQRRRPDLLFLHAAALEWHGRAVLLVAESGVGKSTTAWGLLHEKFGYLSDELAPIDLAAMAVWPCPRSLCLKDVPDEYRLPGEALDLGATLHVPPKALPGVTVHERKPLGAVFILSASPRSDLSAPRRLSAAEAAARLYTHVLNALAHPNHGLDAVLRIAESVPCYALGRGDLRAMGAAVRGTVDELLQGDEATGVAGSPTR